MLQKVLVLWLSSVFFCSIYAQNIEWSAEQKFTRNIKGNDRPRVVKLDEQHGIMVWGAEGDQSIWYSTWNNAVFEAPKKVNISGSKAFVTDWANTEIAGKNNIVYIVFKADPADTASIYLCTSEDFGNNFSNPIEIVKGNQLKCRFPGVSIDNNLNPIVSYMLFREGWGKACYVSTRSSDLGKSFAPYVFVTDTLQGEACDCCPVSMENEGDRVGIVFRNNRKNIRNMTAVVSTTNGENYSIRKEMDTLNWNLNSCPASGGDLCFEGNMLHTVWMSGRSGVNKVYYSALNLTNNKVENFLRIDNKLGINQQQNNPRMAIQNDTIGMVWQEFNRTTDVFFSWAKTNATTELINHIGLVPANVAGHQINPDILYQNGSWMIIWQDNQDNSVRWRNAKIVNTTKTVDNNTAQTKIYYSNSKIYIESEKPIADYRVYNKDGKFIVRNISDKSKINVLQDGIYFASINYLDGTSLSTKFIVK